MAQPGQRRRGAARADSQPVCASVGVEQQLVLAPREIAGLTWKTDPGAPAVPGLGIQACIRELGIPNVSALATDGAITVRDPAGGNALRHLRHREQIHERTDPLARPGPRLGHPAALRRRVGALMTAGAALRSEHGPLHAGCARPCDGVYSRRAGAPPADDQRL